MSESILNSRQSLEAHIDHLRIQFDKHHYLRVDVKNGKQRSLTQNASLQLYCEHVAKALNDAGLDFRSVLHEGIEVPWTRDLVKDHMWRKLQVVITGHKSTTKPERHQYGEIYEVLNRHLSGKLGVFVSWPSKDREDK